MRMISAMAVGAALALVGCGGSGANIPQGPMPQGGSFTGVWHSPQYGEMHMVQTGNQVVGEYHKNERRGRIQGTVQGNVMRFEWTERRELISGVPQTTRGRGYFVYAIGQDEDHYIQGRWGVDDDNQGGGAWEAVRSRRREPQLGASSSGGSGDSNVEEFDSAGGGAASDDLGEDDSSSGGLDLGDL